MKFPSAYNAILKRPNLWTLKAMVSSYHLMVKFSTTNGVRKIRGNQTVARQCFAAKLQAEDQVKIQPELPIGLDARDDLIEDRVQPSDELLEISLRKKNPHQTLKIGSNLNQVT
ncbi:hypothetical protein COCNU_07G012800 [Cocos nucifera]|uniref:Uncharacterized protein n=1 Tax=Cocos nucifera TaxID=13894 RepID=A0A8K0IHB5_COCNU|nr:hypothetical protein COCNU_07G012800 [Cocos nucifera]